jgi:F5/8 type C domain
MSGAAGQRGGRAATALGLLALLGLQAPPALGQDSSLVLDDFEHPSGWVSAPADGVSLTVRSDSGLSGKAMRLDFDFQGHGGYAVARKTIPLTLPENYAITFWIRGAAPVNNLEFKLVDSTGDNVWWRNQRNFEFPAAWRKVTIRKRQIEFAWGPRGGGEAGGITGIELAITAGTGGRGTVWIDDLRLEPRDPEWPYDLTPAITASSEGRGHSPLHALDDDSVTAWYSAGAGSPEWLEVDFLRAREFGGLTITWTAGGRPPDYAVEWSEDRVSWSSRRVQGSNGGRDHIYLPESEARYFRLRMEKGDERTGIASIAVHPLEWSATPNVFFRSVAQDAPRGTFPRYFSDIQTYWTMVGGNGDGRRSLLSQDGAFEPLAGGFSVEPFLSVDRRLLTWADGSASLSLQNGYLPVPSVQHEVNGLSLTITGFSAGRGDSAAAFTWYRLRNTGSAPQRGVLFLAVRPFQVNPPWQFLGVAGGVAPIRQLDWSGSELRVNGRLALVPSRRPQGFGAVTFDEGDVTEFLADGVIPEAHARVDEFGYASGALAYPFELNGGALTDVFLRFPLSDTPVRDTLWPSHPAGPLARSVAGWDSLLSRVVIDLPPSAQAVEDAVKSALAHMLINRDGPAIEPGARSYRRAWIRDGAMIGNAFLRLGHPEPVRDFIEWYAPYQYESGKVPCCVDARGADPVPEHDSHGELIHIIAEYYRYTGDEGFLRRLWPHIRASAGYIDSLRSTRRTPEYAAGNRHRFYGLMPPSISHEGYSAKPVHSYWDDFWVLRSLADAADMAQVLGLKADQGYLVRLRDQFGEDLHRSIERTIREAGIDYIPGSADLADYDPTSTSIGLEPGGQLDRLPRDVLAHTFDRYLREVRARRDSTGWVAYTPYEWRNVGAFVRLGEPEKAKELLDILFAGRRPAAWNQWPEVIHRDSLAPRFLGDLPHTWVGSDFVRSLIDMIAYVNPADSVLHIGRGIPADWVNQASGIAVKGLPIGRGRIDIRMTRDSVLLEGNLQAPPGGVLVYRPGSTESVRITRLPARVALRKE